MRYGDIKDLKNDTNYFTDETSEMIDRFLTLIDLGVTISEEAIFNDHIQKVVKKVRQKTGWVLMTLYTRWPDIMKTLFKSLIVPHVDFCSQLWMPNKSTDILAIEKV